MSKKLMTAVAAVSVFTAAFAQTRSSPCDVKFGQMHPFGFGVTDLAVAGENWASGNGAEALWEIELCKADEFSARRVVSANFFRDVSVEPMPGNGTRIVWRDPIPEKVEGALVSVWITVRSDADRNRWRMGFEAGPGWAVVKSEFPRIPLKLDLGGEDDRMTCGGSVAGVIRNPAHKRHKRNWMYIYRQNHLAASFYCRCNSDRLFYFACEDADGNDKGFMCIRRVGKAIVPRWIHSGWWTGRGELPYDVVTACQSARPGRDCDWYDGADLYREWALKQKWCAHKLTQRDDLADVYRQGPAIFFFKRGWLDDPDYLMKWVDSRRREGLGDAPAFVVLVGWEKWCEWVGPDYFPAYPTDERFRDLLRRFREKGVRPFIWPSCYNYAVKWQTPDYMAGPRLSFDHYAEAERDGVREMAMIDAKGGWTHHTVWMGRNGEMASLCPMAEGTEEWFERTAVRPLMERGAVALQLDQLNHLLGFPCWSRRHGHQLNTGAWLYNSMRDNLVKSYKLMKTYDKEASIAGEGPCEMYLGIYALQDVRDCRFSNGDWGNAFTYIYHDFVLPFQAGCHTNPFWYAKSAAEGQMPQFPSDRAFYDDDARFKDAGWERFCSDWARLYHGEGRKYLSLGKMVRPPRLECAKVPYKEKWRFLEFDHLMPAVFHAAFEAEDGTRALSLVNSTAVPQTCSFETAQGRTITQTLEPREMCIVPMQ